MIPFPNKKYNIIYADPPWHFKTYSNKGEKRSAVQHYNCMSINDIYDLPVKDISDDNAILFLWAIDSMLPEALEVIKRWGFKYKTVGFTGLKKIKNQIVILQVWVITLGATLNNAYLLLKVKLQDYLNQ